jgi:hypothetical protein
LAIANCLRIIPIPKRISMKLFDILTVRESSNIAHMSIIAELASNGMDPSVYFRAATTPDPPVSTAIALSNLRIRTPV